MKKLHLIFVGLFVVVVIYANNETAVPMARVGKCIIEGKILQDSTVLQTDNLLARLDLPYPFTSRYDILYSSVNKDGTFQLNFPVEYTPVTVNLLVANLSIPITFLADSIVHITILLDKEGNLKNVTSNGKIPFNSTDINRWFQIYEQMSITLPREAEDRSKIFSLTSEEFAQFQLAYNLQPRLGIAERDTLLSSNAKKWIISMFTLFFAKQELFQYQDVWRRSYKAKYPNTIVEESLLPKVTTVYYSFLKQLKLNDISHSEIFGYTELLKAILADKTLNLPAIAEMPVADWQQKVKETMAPLVGFDNGLFYDLLTTNAYCRQFENELCPFSAKQIANIKAYYKESEIAKILLARNQEIEKMASEKPPLVINQTPDVPKEKVVDAIISNYKGKVVYVDLWATWCGPCMNAIQESRGVKAKMKSKDVVFVYLTNESSPKPLWDEKIKGIGGEQYRLNAQQWEVLMTQTGFDAIPSYLFYDKTGKLVKKYTGYRGNQEVLDTLNGLLQ